nr:uncharacterized protein LOC112701301 [Arachis hypogaea]
MSDACETHQQPNIDSDQEEDDVVCLEERDVLEGIDACSKSLVGRLFIEKTFSIGTLDNAFNAIWGRPQGFRVTDMGNNHFQFFFDNEVEAIRIEKGWSEEDTTEANKVSSFPIWTQLSGLPEKFKTIEVGRKICGKVGKVIDIDFFDVRGKESRIIKAKIEINGEQQIKDSLKIAGPDKSYVEIGLRYKKIGKFCTYCALLGHESKGCSAMIRDSKEGAVTQDRIGDWVRANQVGRRIDRDDDKASAKSSFTGSNEAKPRRKPASAWLIHGFSSLSMKDQKGGPLINTGAAQNDNTKGIIDAGKSNQMGSREGDSIIVLDEIPVSNLHDTSEAGLDKKNKNEADGV